MRLLLDTHVLLWAALEDSDNALLVSAASAWEIATKWRLGKLSHAGQVVHNDPQVLNALAARVLAAQAMASDLVLVSSDPAFRLFPGLELLS